MVTYDFQLTYTITSYSQCENEKAKKARRVIKEIDGWEAVDKIETTVVGEISFVCYGDNDDKRKKCEDLITEIIKDKFKEEYVYSDTQSYFSLMVDGLGKHITFYI